MNEVVVLDRHHTTTRSLRHLGPLQVLFRGSTAKPGMSSPDDLGRTQYYHYYCMAMAE